VLKTKIFWRNTSDAAFRKILTANSQESFRACLDAGDELVEIGSP
jgi:hypothetical protein